MTKIDISSLDVETKNKLDYYVDLTNKMEEGIPVDININFKLSNKPHFKWDYGMTGFLSPNSSQEGYCKYNLDWEYLKNQENAIEDKYNSLIKEITDFSDSVADSLKVDREEFFEEFFL